jgi:hypothetical protein
MITRTEQTFSQATLSVYLGGGGVMVGNHLLTMMETLTEDERDFIRPYFIDSQQPALRDHSRSRHFYYNNLDVFSEPTYERFTERRFPQNLGVSPVINSSMGCGVTRIFGAASLVACRDNFESLIDQALGSLRDKGGAGNAPLQVFLTASSCGGTGAGMILDAAALLRHFLRLKGENPRIFLFLIGPTVYLEDSHIKLREDQRVRMRASTYALLKELHHFAKGKEFVSSYRLRDQPVVIGNQRDDDRLFDWVYFIDGRPEDGGSSRSLNEVTWTLAEAQLHLSLTEVGRRIGELLPNQREERVNEYPLHFVHYDNRGGMTHEEREDFGESSRMTFLASLGVRNVRFPAPEIRNWFRWGWVRDALHGVLRRKPSLVEEYDTLLGYDRGDVKTDGLLASLGLKRDLILAGIADADPEKKAPNRAEAYRPDSTVRDAESVLRFGDLIVQDMTRHASILEKRKVTPSELEPVDALVTRVLEAWSDRWEDGLKPEGAVTRVLWQLAFGVAEGRGVEFLNDFLVYTTGLLMRMASDAEVRSQSAELERRLAQLRNSTTSLKTRYQRAENEKLFSLRLWWARRRKQSPYRPDLHKAGKLLANEANDVRAAAIAQRKAQIANAVAPRVWKEASLALEKWRNDVLAPAITAATSAFALADNRYGLAVDALQKYRGVNARGAWESFTTVHLADEPLLRALGGPVSDVRVENLVLVPLEQGGITHLNERLTIRDFGTMRREVIVDVIHAHISEATDAKLAFLDDGWMIPEAASRLGDFAAPELDRGAAPLVRFSNESVGQPRISFLIAPRNLRLPKLFGQELGRMPRFYSRDPLQLGVVTFIYGVPPNTLDGMEDLFHEYAIHLGDQERFAGEHDRYPLHVFRDAPEGFDEPHSPQGFRMSRERVRSLLEAAREIFAAEGEMQLDIRPLDPNAQALDHNQFIELTEKVLHRLILAPKSEVDRLFRDGRHPDLKRLYYARCFRTSDDEPNAEQKSA